jgi:hypothetical protein
MTYNLKDVSSWGFTGAEYDVLEVNLMATDEVINDYWDTSYDVMSREIERVYNNTSLSGGLTRKYSTDLSLDCDNLRDSANSWLNNNGFHGDGVYCWFVGSCAAHDIYFADLEGAWNNRRIAFVGQLSRDSIHQLAVQTIHESLHPYLYADSCEKIQEEILNGDTGGQNSNDHNLGDVYTSWWGDDASPMLRHYGDSEATAGNCSDNAWTVDGYSSDVNDCTMRALEMSSEHAAGNH